MHPAARTVTTAKGAKCTGCERKRVEMRRYVQERERWAGSPW